MNHHINNLVAALNGLGAGFCDFAGNMFIQAGILVVALLVVDLLIRKRIRATFRYWMWMLVFVKLLLPPTFSLPTGVGYWLGDYLGADRVTATLPSDVAPPEPVRKPAPSAIAKAPYESATPAVSAPPIRTATSNLPSAADLADLNVLTWQGVVFGFWVLGVLTMTALLSRDA